MSGNFAIRINGNGSLTVNGVTMPGYVSRVSVNGQMILDEQQTLLTSGKEKTFNGFDDADIRIYLTLLEETDGGTTRYDKLQILSDAFKKLRSEQPVVYALEGNIFRANQLKAALFRGLSSDDSSGTDSLEVVITLAEHSPVVAKVQAQQASAITTSATAAVDTGSISDAEVRNFKKLEGYYE